MKKIVKVLLVLLVVEVVFFAVYFGYRGLIYKEAENYIPTTTTQQTTTQPSTTESTTQTTKPSTTASTKPTTTKEEEHTTQLTTVLDVNSLSIIDLYPLSLSGGDRDIKHCQGIAVDKDNGFMYYSYTTMLIKCDFDGNIVASVTGIDGHMGDITYNKADGKIYCGYYATGRTGFYVYIFDTKKITKMNMKPTSDIVRSVYVKEAYEDLLYSWVQENDDGTKKTMYHRYNVSGIDGVTMGPDFSQNDKSKEYLTVAYGIMYDTDRKDNNYQVLLQYDITGWWDKYGQPYSTKPHRVGPDKCAKYFVYTGNTKYGVQTMEYFDELNIWLLNCYKGEKNEFNKYTFFAIDGDFKPKKQKLKGMYEPQTGNVLTLYTDGHHDKKHEIWGYYSKYGVQGVAYMGDGLFYVCQPYKTWTDKKLAICYLNVWKSDSKGNGPYALCVDVPNDYQIKKAKHIKPTAPPTTAKPTTTQNKDIIGQVLDKIF